MTVATGKRWRAGFCLLLMVQKSGDHQLRLVVYPIIYKLLYMPGGFLAGFLVAINSRALLLRGWIYCTISTKSSVEIYPKKWDPTPEMCDDMQPRQIFREDTANTLDHSKKNMSLKKSGLESRHTFWETPTPEFAQCTVDQVETCKMMGFLCFWSTQKVKQRI